MTEGVFNAKQIEDLGWRQGSVLIGQVEEIARSHAPSHLVFSETDWLIISSHDCDIANFKLNKEPVVEVLRVCETKSKVPDKQQAWGRNPRTIHFEGSLESSAVVLKGNVHDRWTFPREKLLLNGPCTKRSIDDRIRRIIAEWLAKRYIRAAFPSQFDARWKGEQSKNLKIWTHLLDDFNRWVQGIYLRLNTMSELNDLQKPYRCHIIVAIPEAMKDEKDWPKVRDKIEKEIAAFWDQFKPTILCDEIEVLMTDEITLADVEYYQRFDADWLSFSDEDDIPVAQLKSDFRS